MEPRLWLTHCFYAAGVCRSGQHVAGVHKNAWCLVDKRVAGRSISYEDNLFFPWQLADKTFSEAPPEAPGQRLPRGRGEGQAHHHRQRRHLQAAPRRPQLRLYWLPGAYADPSSWRQCWVALREKDEQWGLPPRGVGAQWLALRGSWAGRPAGKGREWAARWRGDLGHVNQGLRVFPFCVRVLFPWASVWTLLQGNWNTDRNIQKVVFYLPGQSLFRVSW